jgi:hypothetical protein
MLLSDWQKTLYFGAKRQPGQVNKIQNALFDGAIKYAYILVIGHGNVPHQIWPNVWEPAIVTEVCLSVLNRYRRIIWNKPEPFHVISLTERNFYSRNGILK